MKNRLSANARLSTIFWIAIFCLAGFATPVRAVDSKASKDSGSPFNSNSSGSSSSSASSGSYGLVQDWQPTNELKPYKQTYFLAYSHSSDPDNYPTSPNPLNQVTTSYALQNVEVKFQFSVKHILAEFQDYGSLWLGYTQLAFWQVYNGTTTQPFRETNYEPEFIYSFKPGNSSVLNMAVVHQSIGQSNPSERSWNRVYIEPGRQFDINSDERVIVQIKWWQILQTGDLADNPDIGSYQGYRELNLRYIQDGGWKVNVMSRILSTQVDIAAPLLVWLRQPPEGKTGHNVDIHVQYFNGFGAGLLEYNQSHTEVGLGISFPL